MTTKNNITGDSLITKAPTDAYRNNWDNIFKKIEVVEDTVEKDVHKEMCFECNSPEGIHKMDCESKSVFDAYIILRDTSKWKHFTESMLNTLEFKVWTEQQDRKYSNMFKEE